MALIHANFFSTTIAKNVGLYAVVPEGKPGPFPVLYLLHGLSDDYTIWLRRTRIEAFLRELPMIVVMPDGYRGFYTDNAEGPAYGKYMTDEIRTFVENTLPASKKREHRAIGGLSMGGYGALRCALERPDLYVSAHSHSGATRDFAREVEWMKGAEIRRIFGSNPVGTHHDIYHLAEKAKKHKPLVKLRIDCGTEDFLLKANREFHTHLKKIKYPHEYIENPGMHEWDYWEIHIQKALVFHAKIMGLPIPNYLK